MKVLLFTNLFPTSTDPNRGLFTAQLARELASLCSLSVVVPLPWAPSGKLAARLIPKRYAEMGSAERHMTLGDVEAFYPRYPLVPKVSERFHAPLMQWGVGKFLERLHRRVGFDVINAHWLYPDGVAAVSLGARLGIPVVLTGLGCDVNEFPNDARMRRSILRALEECALITTVSTELASVLRRLPAKLPEVRAIPNGVDTRLFHIQDRRSARTQLGITHEGPLVVCVSRLSHEKGVATLVDATARLVTRHPEARVVVVGDGDERRSLEARIAQLGLADRIRLVGAVPHIEVAKWIGGADLVCMPSLREGHPNAAMETLACGRPLVASRVGALQSMVDSTTGLLVRPGDPEELGNALAQALDTQWQASKIASTVAGSSWQASARRYRDAYEAAGHRPSRTDGGP